jgi:hypothetical protein
MKRKSNGALVMHMVAMIGSPAWRAPKLAARLFLDRLKIEYAQHGGKGNGQLEVSYDQFATTGFGAVRSRAPSARQSLWVWSLSRSAPPGAADKSGRLTPTG